MSSKITAGLNIDPGLVTKLSSPTLLFYIVKILSNTATPPVNPDCWVHLARGKEAIRRPFGLSTSTSDKPPSTGEMDAKNSVVH